MTSEIQKFKLSPGSYFVSVPKIDFHLLCGSPSGIIKILKRKGFLSPYLQDGLSFQKGPNAVLLADHDFQNLSFSNAAEFPLLHMFYLQHSCRPLLIGTEQALKAQEQYFRYGQKGLSEQELKQTGLSPETVSHLLRLKSFYLNGNKSDFSDLVHRIPFEAPEIRIRPEITLKRRALNLYTLRFRQEEITEEITIDLNLKPGESYEASCRLGTVPSRPRHFSVIHFGAGNGWTPEDTCMGSILCHKGKYYLIDLPPELKTILPSLGINLSEIEGIFHTHVHDDHFLGVEALLEAGRPFRSFGTAPVLLNFRKKFCGLSGCPPALFNKIFRCETLPAEQWTDIDGLRAAPFYSAHPIETTVFYFKTSEGNRSRSYGHLADIGSFEKLEQFRRQPGCSESFKNFLRKIEKNYKRKADLKKIDIGGGAIHGQAEDFRKDRSSKIIFSHLNNPLETETLPPGGILSSFGAHDTLLPARPEDRRRQISALFRKHFSFLRAPEIKKLKALSRLREFTPGERIDPYRKEDAFLLLTISGSLEEVHSLQSGERQVRKINTQLLLGLPRKQKTLSHYRSFGPVQGLVIPFQALTGEEEIRNKISAFSEEEPALRKSLVYGEYFSDARIPQGILREILRKSRALTIQAGTVLPASEINGAALIEKGRFRSFPSREPGTSEKFSKNQTTPELDFTSGHFLPGSLFFPCLSFPSDFLCEEKALLTLFPDSVLEETPCLLFTIWEEMNRNLKKALLESREKAGI